MKNIKYFKSFVFSLSFVILGVLFLFLFNLPVKATCIGSIRCGTRYQVDPYLPDYTCGDPELSGGGGCAGGGGNSSQAACGDREDSLINSCAYPECSFGACSWVPPSESPTPTSPPLTPVPTLPPSTPVPTIPPGCSCGGWSNAGCGAGSCSATEMRQTRSCSPSGCSSESRCVSDPSCTGPTPSCLVSLTPVSQSTYVGTPVDFTATVTVGSGSVSQVNFSSTDVSVATVSPASDLGSPYNTTATTLASGLTTISADVVMEGVVRCSDSEVLTVNSASCTVDFGSSSYSVDSGLTTAVSASGTPLGGTISQYEFTVDDTGVATICDSLTTPCPSGSGYVNNGASSLIHLTGQSPSPPTTTVHVTATMVEGPTCTETVPATVTVNNPSAWWQVKEGDVVTDGAISSAIPPTAYEDYLVVNDADEFPGVPTYQGSLSPASPNVSSQNWNTSSAYASPIPDYAFFAGRVAASSLNNITTSTINTATLIGGTTVNGYKWYKYDGSVYGSVLTIDDSGGTVDIGTNKVVLFVKDADLKINSKINLTDGQGFFMAIVQNDIDVDPGVGGAHDTSPDLEGIYIADGYVRTGAGNQELHFRGSVVGNSGVVLERELTDNSQYPGELFEFGVDQMLSYPADLVPNRLIWREVAP